MTEPRSAKNSLDSHFMRRALSLARRGMGTVSPNPMVGAVLVQGREIVGSGFHQRAGEAHAEVLAIRSAGSLARSSTLYVTLEPCRHHGKTPPCVDAILAAGIRRVVIACRDPNPQASGGLEFLKERGIEVTAGCEEETGERLLRAWLFRIKTGRQFTFAAVGRSLDGRFFRTVDEWTPFLSRAAKRRKEKLESEHRAEGKLNYPADGEISRLGFLRDTQYLYVFTLPQFLGAQGIAIEAPPGTGVHSPSLKLDFSRRLGQTVLTGYSIR